LIEHPNATFIGVANGDSMQGVRIFYGDLLIVDRHETERHGDVIAADTMIYKSSQRPLNQLMFSAIEQRKVNQFLKGEAGSVPKHLFWQCVVGAFKNLTKFDKYLHGHALIHTVMAKDIIADTHYNFKVKLYLTISESF
jgi:hypothetical protein